MEQGAIPARHLFGAYEIIETVGQGGMGVVYRAYDTVLKRVVALKILRDDLRDQPHLVARFQREAEAFASLNHPNIVHIYSVGRVGRIPYIAMECIDGIPLSRLLKAERRLPWPRALEIAHEIAQALACAHRAQIIHRDIKPGNIIIAQDGHAYVTDFGIAKVLNAETQLTVDGSRLGTPQYMSPERCQNKETTAASDIYSLGILLFQMIAGRLPFHSDTSVTLIQQIMRDTPPRLSSIRPDVPENVDRLVAYMIEKSPDARPASADLLCGIISRVRDGKPLTEQDEAQAETVRNYRDIQSTPMARHRLGLRLGRISRWVLAVQSAFRRNPGYRTIAWAATLVVAAMGVSLLSYLVTSKNVGAAYTGPAIERSVALWQDPGPVARFVQEGAGVMVATVSMPQFDVSRTAWLSPAKVLIQLDGVRDTANAGQSAVIVLDSERQRAEVVIPAHPNGQHSLLAGAGLEMGIVRLASGDGELFAWSPENNAPFTRFRLRSADGASPVNLGELGAIVSCPDAQSYLVAVEDRSRGRWTIGRMSIDGSLEPYVDSAAPVVALHASAALDTITYVIRQADGTNELFLLRGMGATPVSVGRGRLGIRSGALSHNGGVMLITDVEYSRPTLVAKPTDLATAAIDLGDGWAAGWTLTDEAVFTALDNQGRTQIWTCPIAPAARRQRTYLSDGTFETCWVSPDGRRAVGGVEGGDLPSIVFVDLGP